MTSSFAFPSSTSSSLRSFRSSRGARLAARTSLGLTALSALLVACSANPGEATGKSAAASTVGELLTRRSSAGQITDSNGGCLDLPNGSTTNGTKLQIWACDGDGLHQTWFVDTKGSIHYGADPFKCVDFPASSLVNGVPTDMTQLQLWDCNYASGPDQVWTFSWAEQIEFSADTNKCVELRNGSAANGNVVQVYDCNGTSGQTWRLLEGNGVQAFQLQDGNGECLDIPNGNEVAGQGLQLWQCDGNGLHQSWVTDGYGGIHPADNVNLCLQFPSSDYPASGFVGMSQLQLGSCGQSGTEVTLAGAHNLQAGGPCVEARNGSPLNGTVVQGFACNGTTGQTWFPKPLSGACPGPVAGDGTCQPCGGSGQPTCGGSSCGAGLAASSGKCVPCGGLGELVCPSGPACNPATPAIVPVDGQCNYEYLTGSGSYAANGNGGVIANMTVTADSNGTLELSGTVWNSNQLTGYDYAIACSVGDHEIAYVGNVPNSGVNLVQTSWTSVAVPAVGMVSPKVTSDWPNIVHEWTTTPKCTLTAISTLSETLNSILTSVANAYLSAFGLGNISTGDLCALCSPQAFGAPCDPSSCNTGGNVQKCGVEDEPACNAQGMDGLGGMSN